MIVAIEVGSRRRGAVEQVEQVREIPKEMVGAAPFGEQRKVSEDQGMLVPARGIVESPAEPFQLHGAGCAVPVVGMKRSGLFESGECGAPELGVGVILGPTTSGGDVHAVNHNEAPAEHWTVTWMDLLPKMEFTLEVIKLDDINPHPDLMSVPEFITSLQERADEREESVLRGISIEPLLINRNGFQLMDGYTRYTVLKRYTQKEVYAYVGST